MKTLVLGKMPAEASPRTHIAAGPWCFAGQENLFPHWEKDFVFAPEPLADSSRLKDAASAAQTLCLQMIPLCAKALCYKSGDFSPAYWQTLLGPWCIGVAVQIVEKSLRASAMLSLWQNEELLVPLLEDSFHFDFASEHDFAMRGALGTNYAHWLFSLLLGCAWPAAWKKDKASPCPGENPPAKTGRSSLAGLRSLARSLLFRLPFPRLKGMSASQALRYSAALLHPCQGPDHSLDPEKAFSRPETLRGLLLPPNPLAVFLQSMPRSIRNLRHRPQGKSRFQPRLRVASVAAYEDSAYRQKLARWRQAGNRLAFAQHGGNYGQVKVACETALVEYSQDVFFTWGWKNHGSCPGNFMPMPYPQLAALANRWRAGQDAVFVGTEMAAFGYRLDSRPTPLQFLEYREAKARFFTELGNDLAARTLYRPYFDLPGTLRDAAWLLPRFPGLRLCKGPLLPHLLRCRLLILDHHGTTMLEAFAANIPVILYWNREHWPLTPACENLLDMLAECGIWQPGPEAAARKAREIWRNPSAWYGSDRVKRIRDYYRACQAMLPDGNLDACWISALKKL